MRVVLETTADGSPTFYREDIDEHYHSVKGALAESQHVYIDTGWSHAARQKKAVRVFEVGFGSGLNAALTADAALREAVSTEYYSVELYPLSSTVAAHYSEGLPVGLRESFEAVNSAPWQSSTDRVNMRGDTHAYPRINPYFTLIKLEDNLLTMTLPTGLDVVYFDAFAPEKQPEMWDASVFRRLYEAMSPGGVLTTYCAKGAIRRLLEQIGFRVERLPGPPAGKREILRATRPA